MSAPGGVLLCSVSLDDGDDDDAVPVVLLVGLGVYAHALRFDAVAADAIIIDEYVSQVGGALH